MQAGISLATPVTLHSATNPAQVMDHSYKAGNPLPIAFLNHARKSACSALSFRITGISLFSAAASTASMT